MTNFTGKKNALFFGFILISALGFAIEPAVADIARTPLDKLQECALTTGQSSACPNPLTNVEVPGSLLGAASDPGQAIGPTDLYGWCRYVNNTSVSPRETSVFVPFASANEWVKFITNAPATNDFLNLVPCARPMTITVDPDCTPVSPSAADGKPVSAPYAPYTSPPVSATPVYFQCKQPGLCDSCGCGADQTWIQSATAVFTVAKASQDGNTGPEADWTSTVIYGGSPPPANPAPASCTPPTTVPGAPIPLTPPQTTDCSETLFGTACTTPPGNQSIPPNTNEALGYLYALTPIPNPAAAMGVAGSMSLLTYESRIPNLVFSASQIDIPLQPYLLGFPGYTQLTDWFGFCYSASWTAPTTGAYTFVTAVDDAVDIWIDGTLVGENSDGTITSDVTAQYLDPDSTYNPGPVAMPSVNLAAGQHNVRVMYYQGWPVKLGAQVWVYKPGENYPAGATPPDANLMQLGAPPNDAMACP